jgi:hypothetical protein
MGTLARFFASFWGWADYEPKHWSGAAYKRNWRKRAQETRAVVVQMSDAHTGAVLLGIAQEYEKLAHWAEQHAGEPH